MVAKAETDHGHFTKCGDKGDGMKEYLFLSEYSQKDVDSVEFRTTSEKFRKDLVVTYSLVSRVFHFDYKDVVTVPLADVNKFVMGQLRHNQTVDMGMEDDLGGQTNVDRFVMGHLYRNQKVGMTWRMPWGFGNRTSIGS